MRQKIRTTVVLIIIQFKQQTSLLDMALREVVRPFFQLLGVMFLTSQTFLMALSIISGIISALATFLWAFTLLGFDFLFSGASIVLLAWIFIIKRYSNRELFNFMTDFTGKSTVFEILPCEKCKTFKCNKFFDECCHSYHSQCIQQVQMYVEGKKCPKCYNVKRRNESKRYLVFVFFSKIVRSRLFWLKLVTLGAITYSCCVHVYENPNFSFSLPEVPEEN